MAIHGSNSGPLRFSEIQAEFTGSHPIRMSEYIRGGSYVPNAAQNQGIPTSTASPVRASAFFGAVRAITMTYEIIGGGGEGGGGSYGGNGNAGGASSFSGSGFTTVTANGGSGGAATGLWGGAAGASSHYGSGGAGGLNSDSGNQSPGYPASGYGAGGGGGGSAPFSAYNGGYGGGAGTRKTGSFDIVPGTVVSVTIGSGGSGRYGGGDGKSGYAKFTVGGQTFTYTSSGSFTVPG